MDTNNFAATTTEKTTKPVLLASSMHKDDSVKPMSSKTDVLSLFDNSSFENDDLSPSARSPSETVTTTNLAYSFDTLETEKRNSPSSIFRETKTSTTTDLLDTPASASDYNNSEGVISGPVKRSSSSVKKAKKKKSDDSVTRKSTGSNSTKKGPKKKVKKRVPDPPDISKFFNEESTVSTSTLHQRNNGSQKWQQAPAKKVKKTFPDSVDLPAGYNPRSPGNGEYFDIEAVKALVEHAQASIDPSVTLSLERTLYAALQHSWLLALGGVGLMSVGENKKVPTGLGIALLAISIVSVLAALMMHYIRLFQIKSGRTFKFWQTALFTSLVTLCILVTLALELYFGILYPYLLRTMSVQVENLDEDDRRSM